MERKRVQKIFSQPSLTQQQFKDDVDVNMIMKRHVRQELPPVDISKWQVGDASAVSSLQDALFVMQDAAGQFDNLPANVRERFGNDPIQLLQFIADPSNRDEAVQFGFVQKLNGFDGEKAVAVPPVATPAESSE